ncbi:MAG: hypothetical protein WA948_00920 [Pontixanthobacter sp.]
MKLLKSDLSRNFAIGFVAGALIVLFQFDPGFADSIIPQAIAGTIR